MKQLLTILFLLSVFFSFAQRRELTIQRITESVDLDGELNEVFWKDATVLTNFIQNQPFAGDTSTLKTEFRIAYDNSAVYIAAEMFDTRDSMSLTLSQRDEFGNADWCGIVIDPYNSGTVGFAFLVTSAGVQIDELHQVNDIDNNWNAVWNSKVKVKEDRWVAEMKIPFSAIRFPKKDIQTWGVNFVRSVRRKREMSYWNHYDPNGLNLLSQLGVMHGIKNVDSPLRLSFTPYVSGYVENFDGTTGYSVNGGMDLKYGLNEAFTLDMTLIPDFGQVQFDNQVLNLSPFEVEFNENRQFFTEGTELFNKQGLFYSRRVGGAPVNYEDATDLLDTNETVIFNPNTTQLINASKLSGRTKKGTGIGVFNAVTAQMEATILDTITDESRTIETGPASNYNVFVIDQNLKNNSTITLTNTNVLRSGSTYDANVTALGADLFDKRQRYTVAGAIGVSQLYTEDNSESEKIAKADLGYRYFMRIGKTQGSFLWRSTYSESNSAYDHNDLGFLRNNNTRRSVTSFEYNIYKPFACFYKVWSELRFDYARLVAPNEFSEFVISANLNGTFRNFMTAGVWMETSPVKNHNWFEPRVENRFYEADEFVGFGGFASSDYSKSFALDVNGALFKFNETDRFGVNLRVSPRFRINDQFMLIYNYRIDYRQKDEGAALDRDFNVPIINGDPVFAHRNRLTMVNRLNASYIFTNRMGITFSLRHYWAKVEYDEFFLLNEKGLFGETTYNGLDTEEESLHNNSFNAFTIDMAYRWVFAPGSELSFVWKNSIFSSSESVNSGYFENLGGLAELPATNSLSLKILYFIDSWETKQRLFDKER